MSAETVSVLLVAVLALGKLAFFVWAGRVVGDAIKREGWR